MLRPILVSFSGTISPIFIFPSKLTVCQNWNPKGYDSKLRIWQMTFLECQKRKNAVLIIHFIFIFKKIPLAVYYCCLLKQAEAHASLRGKLISFALPQFNRSVNEFNNQQDVALVFFVVLVVFVQGILCLLVSRGFGWPWTQPPAPAQDRGGAGGPEPRVKKEQREKNQKCGF